MSLFKDGVVNINVGETLIGTDEGRLVNTRMEGREASVSHEDIVNGSGVMLFSSPSGRRSQIRVMRNVSGVVLYAGELVVFDPTAGAAGLGQATAKAGADAKFWVVVDPTLPASGVADDDLFIAFVRGPAKVKAPAAGVTLATAGLPVVSAASGRATFGAVDGTESEIIGGFFLGATGAKAADALIEVDLNPPWS